MNTTSMLYSSLILCSALLALGLAGYACRQTNQNSRAFVLFMLAIAEWSFGALFRSLTPDPQLRLLWMAATNVGIAFVGPAWLSFTLTITGQSELLQRRRLGIWIAGAFSLVALSANGMLALASQGFGAIEPGRPILHGPFFWLHTCIAYSMILGGLAVMGRAAISAPSPYREQARTIMIGAVIPLVANFLYLAQLFHQLSTADITPIALVVSSLVLCYTVQRHQLLTLSPIARQVVLDSMVDGLVVVNLAGQIVEHNPAAATIANLAPGAVGRTLGAVSGDQALGEILHLLATSAAPGEQLVAPAGSQRYIQITRTPLYDTASRRLGTLLILRDLTRQTLAEAALARQAADLTALHHVASAIGTTLESRELLPAIVDTTRDALGLSYAAVELLDKCSGFDQTAISNLPGALTDQGTAFDYTGLLDERQPGTPIVIDEPQHDQRLAKLHGQLARQQIQSLLIVPLRANDRLLGTLNCMSAARGAFGRDRLHLAEMIASYAAAAIANAQLFEASQQAVRTKSAILDSINHEFRTPITAILGFTELYQDHVLGPVTKEQHEALNAVHRNAHRLLKLVDDMLDLARLETGKLDLALHPVDLGLCIKEAAAIVRMQSAGKPFQVDLRAPADLPLVHADTDWLRRSLVHLLSYTVGSSQERRVAIHVHSGTSGGAAQLSIDIEGNSHELAENDRATMFEAFERVPNRASEVTISSIARIGLAISKRAIEQMSGQIGIHSQPGLGSRFTISLPAIGNGL